MLNKKNNLQEHQNIYEQNVLILKFNSKELVLNIVRHLSTFCYVYLTLFLKMRLTDRDENRRFSKSQTLHTK